MISKSGSTAELLDMVAPLREFEVRFSALSGMCARLWREK